MSGLRFGVVSCANWEGGYFASYRHLAARGDLDAWLHLGDYIYEYKSGEYAARGTVVRPHAPAHEIITLADYRTRHGKYKTDPDLQALHHKAPVVAIWDDHEFADNAWSGGAVNHTEGAEGTWTDRKAAAKQAYFEWMPVRPAIAGTTYRRLRFGKLADLSLLDLRSFRSQQASTASGSVDDPDRTITGRAQLDWLKAGLKASDTTWRLVGNSVMISPFAVGSLSADLLKPLAKLLGLPQEGLALNTDQWDGYTDDRRELLAHLRSNAIRNTVFLTGDIHMAWANDVPVDAGTYPLSASAATEFVVTSVTSDNLDDIVKVPEGTVSAIAAPIIRPPTGTSTGSTPTATATASSTSPPTGRRWTTTSCPTARRPTRPRPGCVRTAHAPARRRSSGPTTRSSSVFEEAERHPPGGLGGLLVVVRQVGVGVQVPGPGVPVHLDVGARPAHLEVPGAQPVVRLERVRLGDMQLHRQLVHRGVRRDVRGAVQEQQPAGLLVAEREGLRDGGAEREPRVHEAPLRVGRGGQDGPLEQLVLADLRP